MHTLQHQMLAPINLRATLLRRRAPSQEHDAVRALSGDGVDDFLREALPPLFAVAVGLVCADGETSIQQQNTAVSPRSEQATVPRRGLEVRVVLFQGDVHVLQTRRSRGWGPDGEAQTMGLVDVVVGVLAQDDGFHIVEWCVARPAVDVCGGREDFLAGLYFGLEEAFEVQEFFGGDFIFEHAEPAFVQGVDFEGEEFFLLRGEFG